MSAKKNHARHLHRRDILKSLGVWAAVGVASKAVAATAESRFQLASFRCDVTCPVGNPLLGGLYADAKSIADPLFAHGIVLLNDEQPIVFCTIDWCEIRNQSYDLCPTSAPPVISNLGPAKLVLFPAEAFVEFQLKAQEM